MTIDVEDYFQVSAFEPYVKRAAWPFHAGRAEERVERILQMCDEADIKATFFTLGWIAERFPDMVRRIVAEGHELASHGWEHRMVTTQRPEEFAEDVTRTKNFLEDLSGVAGDRLPRAELLDQRHQPPLGARRPAGGRLPPTARASPRSSTISTAGRRPPPPRSRSPDNELLEVPISTIEVGSKRIACGGGGWFRLYPYALSRHFISAAQRAERALRLLLPPLGDRSRATADAEPRLENALPALREPRPAWRAGSQRLLQDFEWDRMDRVFRTEIESVTGDGSGPGTDRRSGRFPARGRLLLSAAAAGGGAGERARRARPAHRRGARRARRRAAVSRHGRLDRRDRGPARRPSPTASSCCRSSCGSSGASGRDARRPARAARPSPPAVDRSDRRCPVAALARRRCARRSAARAWC